MKYLVKLGYLRRYPESNFPIRMLKANNLTSAICEANEYYDPSRMVGVHIYELIGYLPYSTKDRAVAIFRLILSGPDWRKSEYDIFLKIYPTACPEKWGIELSRFQYDDISDIIIPYQGENNAKTFDLFEIPYFKKWVKHDIRNTELCKMLFDDLSRIESDILYEMEKEACNNDN